MALTFKVRGVLTPVPSWATLMRAARYFEWWPRLARWYYRRRWGVQEPLAALFTMLAARADRAEALMRVYGLTLGQVAALPPLVENALYGRTSVSARERVDHEVNLLRAALGEGRDKAEAWLRLLAESDPNFVGKIGYDPVSFGAQSAWMREAMRGGNGN